MKGQDHYRSVVYNSYSTITGLNQFLKSKYDSLAHNLTVHLLTAKEAGGRVLDIGSGQGELLALCLDLGIEAEGLDVSQELVNACTSRGLKVMLVGNLITALSENTKTYYIVTLIDVLEHFTKAEALRVLELIRTKV